MARVIVSAGHTSIDPGVSSGDLSEFELTRKIANKVARELRSQGLITLSTPPELDLAKRIEWINTTGYRETLNDIAIEIHINDGGKSGLEAWHREEGDNKSHQLSKTIVKEATKATGLKSQGIKSEYDHQLGSLAFVHNINPIGVLLECLYIDNANDQEFLKDEVKLNDLAIGITKGVLKYLNIEYKELSQATQPQITPAPVQTDPKPQIEKKQEEIPEETTLLDSKQPTQVNDTAQVPVQTQKTDPFAVTPTQSNDISSPITNNSTGATTPIAQTQDPLASSTTPPATQNKIGGNIQSTGNNLGGAASTLPKAGGLGALGATGATGGLGANTGTGFGTGTGLGGGLGSSFGQTGDTGLGAGGAGTSNFMKSRDERKKTIQDTYQKVLGREANQSDLNYFLNIGITEEQLIKRMVDSDEFVELVKASSELNKLKTKSEEQGGKLQELETQVKDKEGIVKNLNSLLMQKNQAIGDLQKQGPTQGTQPIQNSISQQPEQNSPQIQSSPIMSDQPGSISQQQPFAQKEYRPSFTDRLFQFFSNIFE
ncbi:MAG TPA: DUF4214 domain-containing protein [bacterium]|nr:DUF4214 domain-containing protein [bacterium]